MIVVEHDENTIRSSDWVIDIGPEAGKLGGNIIAEGSPLEIEKNEKSLTGQYLSQKKIIKYIKIKKNKKRQRTSSPASPALSVPSPSEIKEENILLSNGNVNVINQENQDRLLEELKMQAQKEAEAQAEKRRYYFIFIYTIFIFPS